MTGAQMRELRRKAGLSQRKLAAIVQCSVTTIANLEAGVPNGRSRVMPRVERALREQVGQHGK